MEESTKERTTRKDEATLEHPSKYNLLVGSNEWDVVDGGSTPLDQRLRRKNSILDKRLKILFGGIGDLELLEANRECLSGNGRARGSLDLLGTGSLGGSHGGNGLGSTKMKCGTLRSGLTSVNRSLSLYRPRRELGGCTM